MSSKTVIGPAEKFYGYIVGLSIEPMNKTGDWGHRMYATFQYGEKPCVYEVPDSELFKILAGHLVDMTSTRDVSDDFGYEKLWIRKEEGGWHVCIP